MKNISDKSDNTPGTSGQLPATSWNDHKNEFQALVTTSGQTMTDAKTPNQASQAAFLYGTAAQTFIDNGSANTIGLTPLSGASGFVVGESYALLDGAIVEFEVAATNTSATVTVNIGQTTGTYLGSKSLKVLGGSNPEIGQVSGMVRLMWDNTNDYWVLIGSDGNFVDLYSNQSIDGVKTFTSIPVLPSSDPTTDNQAARKKYIDDNFLNNSNIYANIEEIIGSGLSISGIGTLSICALSQKRIAFIDASIEQLRTYDFNGSTWSLTGSGFSIPSITVPRLCSMSSTRVAFVDISLGALRAYDFNGSTWSLAGSSLSISHLPFSTCALSSTRIVLVDGGGAGTGLAVYDFNGSTWSQVGSLFPTSGIGTASICALSSTRIALVDANFATLRIYDYSGGTFSLIATSSSLSTIGSPAICALTNDRIAFVDDSFDNLTVFFFDGVSTITEISSGFSISGIDGMSICSMSSSRIAFIDSTLEELRAYPVRWVPSLTPFEQF